MTVDVEALGQLYLGAIGLDTPQWVIEQRLGRLAASVHGVTSADVARCFDLALTAVGDTELVARAFEAIRPRAPQLSPQAAPAPELSALSQRILKRLSPGDAVSRRELHRSVQRHVDSVDELDTALAELAAQGRVRLVGSGSRPAIELIPRGVNATRQQP